MSLIFPGESEVVLDIRQATVLVLQASKQASCAIGCFMAAFISSERPLCLDLMGIKEKKKAFLLNTQGPVQQVPGGQAMAFNEIIPCHSGDIRCLKQVTSGPRLPCCPYPYLTLHEPPM
ncbi:uncharacterized protein LOC107693005 [Tachysurus ichikawai]